MKNMAEKVLSKFISYQLLLSSLLCVLYVRDNTVHNMMNEANAFIYA